MPAPIAAALAGVSRGAAVAVHDMDLAVIAPVIAADERIERLRGAMPRTEERDAVHAEIRIDQGLGRDRPDARSDVGHERADGKELGSDRDTELTAVALAHNDGPGHACAPRGGCDGCIALAASLARKRF